MTDAKTSYEHLDLNEKQLPVIEMFGPVIQGEGAMIGRVTHFLRLGGCGYRCTWCDSLHAVLPELIKDNVYRLTPTQICDGLQSLGDSESGARWITISGGDPVMWDLTRLVENLHHAGYKVAIETQGQFFKPWLTSCDCVTVSPKPPSSGMAEKLDRGILNAYASLIEKDKLSFKVVIMDTDDLQWAAGLNLDYPRVPFFLSVGTKNYGETEPAQVAEQILKRYRWLIDKAQELGLADVAILPQMHAMLYGHKQGV
jgi:7-carboxy-7-deazaguanine synthase